MTHDCAREARTASRWERPKAPLGEGIDLFGSGGAKRELFGNVLQPDESDGFKGPDGMTFGTDGRL